jgi:sodium pump decarboxylase gamma subunit
MMTEGFRLMAVGMFTVFAFLTLLVGLMTASAIFFEKFADRFEDVSQADAAAKRGSQAGRDDEIALALALAQAAREGQKI